MSSRGISPRAARAVEKYTTTACRMTSNLSPSRFRRAVPPRSLRGGRRRASLPVPPRRAASRRARLVMTVRTPTRAAPITTMPRPLTTHLRMIRMMTSRPPTTPATRRMPTSIPMPTPAVGGHWAMAQAGPSSPGVASPTGPRVVIFRRFQFLICTSTFPIVG